MLQGEIVTKSKLISFIWEIMLPEQYDCYFLQEFQIHFNLQKIVYHYQLKNSISQSEASIDT